MERDTEIVNRIYRSQSIANNVNICQMHCDYANEGGRPVIHSFGRDPKNVFERIHVRIEGFEPFFYVGKDVSIESDLIKRAYVDEHFKTSLDNTEVKKIVTFLPSQVREVRNFLSGIQTYQSGVLFPLNFMCSTGIRSGYSLRTNEVSSPAIIYPYIPHHVISDYRIVTPNNDIYVEPLTVVFDIETDNSKSNPSMKDATQPIVMATFMDNYKERQYTFAWHPDQRNGEIVERLYPYTYSGTKVPWKIFLFDNEIEMLRKIKEYLSKVQPDIYSGWNVFFDIGYLVQRLRKVGIDPSFLSPIGDVSVIPKKTLEGRIYRWETIIKGVTVLDMLGCYRGLTRFEGLKDSYALDDVGNDELKLKKLTYQGTVGDFWRNDFKRCVRYNARDVEICYEIMKKLNIMNYHDILRRQVGCQFEDTIHTSRIIETEILRKAMSIGKVVPYNKDMEVEVVDEDSDEEEEKFEGAYVFPVTIGKFHNVITLDLKSLYPSLIITLNISPETRIDPSRYTEEQLKNFIKSAAGHYYRKDVTGFAKDVLSGMNAQRDKFKDCMSAIAVIIKNKEKIDFRDRANTRKSVLKILETLERPYPEPVMFVVLRNLEKIKFEVLDEIKIMAALESEELKYDLMQKAEKAKINTWYGVMGHEGSSLYKIEDAESVTISGQMVIKHSAAVAESAEMSRALKEKFGIDVKLKVISGDTDSLHLAGLDSINNFEMLCQISEFVGKFVTKTYDVFCKENFNVDTHSLKIRSEEFAKVFCQSPRKKSDVGGKKRYWYLPWGEKKGDRWIEYTGTDIKVKGFETKRSNVARIGRDVQREVMKMITFDKTREEVRVYINNVHNNLMRGQFDLEYLTFNVSLKDWSEYKVIRKQESEGKKNISSWGEHVRAAWWGKTYFGQEWKPGDKVKTVYVKKSPTKYEPMDVIAVYQGRVPGGFIIDYKKIFDKQVKERLFSVLATVGWTFKEIISGMSVSTL